MFNHFRLLKKRKLLLTFVFYILISTCYSLLATSLMGCSSKPSTQVSPEKTVYYCPMHPAYISDKPGDCPICNMKLVKREKPPQKKTPDGHQEHAVGTVMPQAQEKTLAEVCIEHNCTMKDCPMKVKANLKPGERIVCPVCGEVISTATGGVVQVSSPGQDHKPAASGVTVMISPERQQLIGVKTARVENRDLKKAIRASGKIAYDPELVITQEEFIQALNNEETIKDSPLAEVINRSKSLTEAARNKLKLSGMSDEQVAQLEKDRKVDSSLYLPAQGENVWAYVAIYEYEIGLIKVGALVDIESVAYPGQTFHGTIAAINPVLDAATRTNQIRVKVENSDNKLKPEMFVNANIKVDLGEKLAIPESALLDTGLRKVVYLSREEGLLEAREVTVGQKAEGFYEVLDGLSEGDIVVISGNFFIDSESKLKSALEGSGHQH